MFPNSTRVSFVDPREGAVIDRASAVRWTLSVLVTLAGTDDASLLRGAIVKAPEQIGTETLARVARQAERSKAVDHGPAFCGGLLHVWQHEFGADRDRARAWAARMNGAVKSSLPWRPSLTARF
jgi:hypothetical protein